MFGPDRLAWPRGDNPIPKASLLRPRGFGLGDSYSNSVDSGLSARSPWWSQSLFIWPLKLCYRRRKTKIHPTNTQPILSSTVDRSFIISSIIPLFVFLFHILPSLLLDTFLFGRDLLGRRLVQASSDVNKF